MNQKKKFKSKGHNSAKNHSTETKFELDLHIATMHLYTKFDCNMCIYGRDNEWKLNDDGKAKRGNTICPGHFMAEA